MVTFAIEDKDKNCNYNAEQYVNNAKLTQSPKNLTCDSLQVCTETSKPMTANIQSYTATLSTSSPKPSLLIMAKVKA